MAASAEPRATSRLLIGRAARGAVAGVAVCAVMYAALKYAHRRIDAHLDQNPEIDGLLVLGATVVTALKVGVPLSYIAGLLVAWATGLRRPWVVSFLGLLLSGLFICMYGVLTQAGTAPRWLPIAMVIGAFAAAAALPPDPRAPS